MPAGASLCCNPVDTGKPTVGSRFNHEALSNVPPLGLVLFCTTVNHPFDLITCFKGVKMNADELHILSGFSFDLSGRKGILISALHHTEKQKDLLLGSMNSEIQSRAVIKIITLQKHSAQYHRFYYENNYTWTFFIDINKS